MDGCDFDLYVCIEAQRVPDVVMDRDESFQGCVLHSQELHLDTGRKGEDLLNLDLCATTSSARRAE
jgi:hypothetical protein